MSPLSSAHATPSAKRWNLSLARPSGFAEDDATGSKELHSPRSSFLKPSELTSLVKLWRKSTNVDGQIDTWLKHATPAQEATKHVPKIGTPRPDWVKHSAEVYQISEEHKTRLKLQGRPREMIQRWEDRAKERVAARYNKSRQKSARAKNRATLNWGNAAASNRDGKTRQRGSRENVLKSTPFLIRFGSWYQNTSSNVLEDLDTPLAARSLTAPPNLTACERESPEPREENGYFSQLLVSGCESEASCATETSPHAMRSHTAPQSSEGRASREEEGNFQSQTRRACDEASSTTVTSPHATLSDSARQEPLMARGYDRSSSRVSLRVDVCVVESNSETEPSDTSPQQYVVRAQQVWVERALEGKGSHRVSSQSGDD
ncbi:hypothetical protein AB1Y20_018577 [Prymnesium parvum]|uniref:Uncharacterized protein n=1 Tax=Prymnesium parvum TaxID=97485 RepID=A0AB34JRX2_PRYPA